MSDVASQRGPRYSRPGPPSFRIGHVRSFLLRKTATDNGDGLGDFGEKKRSLIVTFGAAATVRSNSTRECTRVHADERDIARALRVLLRNARTDCVTVTRASPSAPRATPAASGRAVS